MKLKLRNILILATISFFWASAQKRFKLPSSKRIISESLAFVVKNIGYDGTWTFHLSYSAQNGHNAHVQASIINDFLLKTVGELIVSLDDLQLTRGSTENQRTFTLLLVDSLNSFQAINPLLTARKYDTDGKHLVVVMREFDDESLKTLIVEVFAKFFANNIVNVELMVKNRTTGFIDFYTFFPVSKSYCFKVIPVLHNTFNGSQLMNGFNLFPRKFANFFGCPLTVATFKFAPHVFLEHVGGKVIGTGIDLKVLYAVAEKLNFTVIIIDTILRGIHPNGTLDGAIKMLYEKRANITLGGYGSAAKVMLLFSPSVAYLHTVMVFAVPPPQEYSPLERLLLPFEPDVWFIIGLTFGLTYVTSFTLNALNKPLRERIFGPSLRYPLFEMAVVYLGGGVARFPKGGIARNVILQWLIVSLVLSSCYKAILFGMLKTGFVKKFPSTVEEMMQAGYVIDVPVPLMQNLKDGPLGRFADSFRLLEWNIHQHYALLQTGTVKRMVIDSNIQLQHFNSIHYEDGILQSLAQQLFIFPMYFYYQKKSYLVKPIDDVLKRFIQSGLITFWKNEVLNVSHLEKTQTANAMNPLLLKNFRGCFALCWVLIGCSLGAFVLEVLSSRVQWVRKALIYLRVIHNK